ncbi:hypothetical protein ARMSODRAFT_1025539 [Armillaria solidipes]|uniref:DUF6533 domain-containing protein n=1 Tax=Armillaria solidipes TaxID=1076256 RepID=A0A2H3AS78_9AGAR|nr:hypothetical protein ARMSODRAFT_1025539 [Armillaria solidipes]
MSLNELVAAGLRDVRSTRCAALASGVIVLFDHLITLDDEVELIWRSHWSIGKMLFIINRYYTLSSVIFNCYGLFMTSLSDSSSEFHADRLLAAAQRTLPGTSVCASSGIPDYFYAFWIPTIVFESLLCGLALFRGFQTFSSDGPLFSSGRRLVSILIRDSVFYFVVMFATYLTNLLVWTAAPADLLEIPIGFSVTFSCVMSNRIILNVRRASQNYIESKATGPPEKDLNKHMDLLVDDGYVSDIEMMQLRSMRSEHRQPAIVI